MTKDVHIRLAFRDDGFWVAGIRTEGGLMEGIYKGSLSVDETFTKPLALFGLGTI